MARREKHRRAERAKRAGVVVVMDEALPLAERKPANAKAPLDRPIGELEKMVLHGLQSKPVYGGTADPFAVAERRQANRRARTVRVQQSRQRRGKR
jgi:hypothetical protein